ncbi:MAG TPA: type II toxin-antitoxin system RelE/ParE family toxin [Tepidisphaeraceae bacterium]|jgi:hypothetical protein|nr:type II toxin-antitoxin system RelE/ParE family toxin [Tepidisphaeraceae bacterium]
MRRKTIVRPEAANDAIEACRWYDERVAGLGKRFLDELDAAMTSIGEAPTRYPIYRDEIHRARVGRFPFAIFFVVAETRIVVLAVLNLYRNPRLLRRALKRR